MGSEGGNSPGRQVDGWPLVLNTEQAAALLQLAPATVRALAAAGELPAGRLGKEWRFSRDELLRRLIPPAST